MPHTLTLTLYGAARLPAADNVLAGGKSDPYVTFDLHPTAAAASKSPKVTGHAIPLQTSSVIPKTLDPVWKRPEVFKFTVPEPVGAWAVTLRVWDEDIGKADDLLGTATLPLVDYIDPKRWRERETISLALAPEFADHKGPSTVTLGIVLATHELELWENQQFRVVEGWTSETFLPTERLRFTSADPKHPRTLGSNDREDVEPETPKDLRVIGEWRVDMATGDAEGWEYARKFDGAGWKPERFTVAMVRRRRWIRRCVALTSPTFAEDNQSTP